MAQGLPTSVLDHKLMEGRNVCTPVASSCAWNGAGTQQISLKWNLPEASQTRSLLPLDGWKKSNQRVKATYPKSHSYLQTQSCVTSSPRLWPPVTLLTRDETCFTAALTATLMPSSAISLPLNLISGSQTVCPTAAWQRGGVEGSCTS